MTKFEELQQIHQRLLDRMDEVSDADKAAFVREAQNYVTRVRDEAAAVPDPRDRDQLRANLRYWASYVYDATGVYPNTTMRPAQPVPMPPPDNFAFESPATPASAQPVPPAMASPAPPPAASKQTDTPREYKPGWRTWLLVGGIVVLLGALYVWVRVNPQSGGSATSPGAGAAIVQPNTASGQALTLTWRLVTSGPSPFSPLVWVARIELSAVGGNDEYIFWVNGQRLPDTSKNQFTVESQGCQPVSQFIGVTSDSQSARQELVVYPPESSSCSR